MQSSSQVEGCSVLAPLHAVEETSRPEQFVLNNAGKLCSVSKLGSDGTKESMEMLPNPSKKKKKKREAKNLRPKKQQKEWKSASSKGKAVKKKEPSEEDFDPPKARKAKKQEQEPQDYTASKSKTSKKKKKPPKKKAATAKTKDIKTVEPSEKEADVSKQRGRKGRKQMETWERTDPGSRMDSPTTNQTPTPGKLLVKKMVASTGHLCDVAGETVAEVEDEA